MHRARDPLTAGSWPAHDRSVMTVATMPDRTGEFLRLVGDPGKVADDLARFAKSAATLSSMHESLMERYEGQWIALFDGEVIAVSTTLDALLGEIERGHPSIRSQVLVRHMQRELRMLFV